ncbi:MAG: LptF/LptG family permease [Bacteroidales bacterium]|nr:LptF/LptG family permease [Bacteroidales bacterium]
MLGLRKIDWYIAKKFITTFFLSLLLIIIIVIIFDVAEKIDYFVKNDAPLKAIIFDYYFNYIPYLVNMFASLFVFITVIFFTSRMAANSEIVAILSCGVSFHRMIVPYLASAALIALLSLGLNLYVIPHSNATRVDFEAQYIKRHNTYNLRDIHYQISPGQFVYIESFSRWNNTAYKFTIEDMDGHRLTRKVSAETAVWDSTMEGWHLRQVFIRDYSSGLSDKVSFKEQQDTVIALNIKDLFNNEKTVETLDIHALNELIATQKMRGDANVMYAAIERQRRLTMPFSALILTIIGVSLSARKRRGGIGWNIGIGIALAFSYIFFLRVSEMFVYTDTLPPGIALWLPNVLYAVIAYFLYKRACK